METIIIKQELMGYSLEARYSIIKEKRMQREEIDTGMSWGGDQLVPTEYAGIGSEQAISYGNMLEDILVTCILNNVQIKVKEQVFDWEFTQDGVEKLDLYMRGVIQCREYTFNKICLDKDITEKEMNYKITETLQISILDLLCAIIACDKYDQDHAASEYLKIARSVGLNVINSVIPYYDKIMEVYRTMPRA